MAVQVGLKASDPVPPSLALPETGALTLSCLPSPSHPCPWKSRFVLFSNHSERLRQA